MIDILAQTGFDWGNVWLNLLVVAFLVVCVSMILIVLIQRPQGGGLSGAFGSSAGSSQTAFGAKTGDFLTLFTIAIFVVFLSVAVGLNLVINKPPAATPATIQGLPNGGLPITAPSGDDQTGTDDTAPLNTGVDTFDPEALLPQDPPAGESTIPAESETPAPQGESIPPTETPAEENETPAESEGESTPPPAEEGEGSGPPPADSAHA